MFRPRQRSSFQPDLETLEHREVPALLTVTTFQDVINPTDGQLSLREAIGRANATPAADTIVLQPGVYKIAIPYNPANPDVNATGSFDVLASTTFVGAGAGQTIINGAQIDRVFAVTGSSPSSIGVTFQGLTIRGGNIGGDGGGILLGNANVTVRGCVVTGNRSTGDGGGLSNALQPGTGNVTLVNSTVSGNVAGLQGGGLSVEANLQGLGSVLTVSSSTIRRNLAKDGGGLFATTATLTNSTVSGNSASISGGGILGNELKLTNCTVSGNHGEEGGGIYVGTATLIDSTISGNSSRKSGGGIRANQIATLLNSTVSGNSSGRNGGGIFAGTANLTNSTVNGNFALLDGGGILADTATLIKSTVRGNTCTDGGGIDADIVTLTDSTVSGNTASSDGGGIVANTATLTDSTVSGNTASSGGGGGINAAKATLTDSTVSGNHAGLDGGGIEADKLTLINSTVSGNSAIKGGGIDAGILTLLNVTVTDNSAHGGGGIFLRNGGTSSIRNSLIAANLTDLGGEGPDLSGVFTSQGHNLIGDGSGSVGFTNGVNGDQVGTAEDPIDPRLGPLANNGGPTLTHALLPGSRAIDRGDNGSVPATDQRGTGFPRRKDGNGDGLMVVDIGAFEK